MSLKIKHKLFGAMLLANIFVVVGLYVLSSVSFSSSFREYLDANQIEKLMPMTKELSTIYLQYNDWQWARDPENELWPSLIERYMLDNGQFTQLKRRPLPRNLEKQHRKDQARLDQNKPAGHNRETHRPPKRLRPGPPIDERNLRIFLADAKRALILGPVEMIKNVHWIEILSEEQVIGYLGFEKTTEITSELDRLFVSKLKTNLIWSVFLVILVTAAITFLIARILVKPILKLRQATNSISDGNYDTRIEINSQDEIGELCQDFDRLAETLKSNLEVRQQWIADISHELRTPVAILQGELEALQDGVREISMASVNSLHQEIKRLGLLINDLHELSMSDSGALSYHFEALQLTSIIDNVIELKQAIINQQGFNLIHTSPATPIIVKGDSHRLTQLFLNLLNNSLAYSKKGGQIEISYTCQRDQLIIKWSDSEPGVNDAQLNKLFDRLYRGEASRNRISGGSGLGLSIAKNIVEAHGGTIIASHAKLGGVEITILLPIC